MDIEVYNSLLDQRNTLKKACQKAFMEVEASKSYPPCIETAKRILKEAIAKAERG